MSSIRNANARSSDRRPGWGRRSSTRPGWEGRRDERGGEGRGGEGRGWATITFTCPEPGPPVQLSLDLLLGLKGAGAKRRGRPPVTQVASFSGENEFTTQESRHPDETNRKEKLL